MSIDATLLQATDLPHASNQAAAVVARVASFSFGNRFILRNFDLSVRSGEAVALLGPSGCGKSTLIKLLAGLFPQPNNQAFVGSVSLFGRPPSEYRSSGGLSVMFQDPTLLPHLTVEQNIGLPLQILGRNDGSDTAALIRLVGLGEFSSYLPRDLSGGMRTRTALARAFVTKPALLLLDEPFTGLDLGWKQSLYASLQELRSQYGTTVVMVTHDLEEAIYNSDRVILMTSKGALLEEIPILGEFPRAFPFGDTVSRYTSLLSRLAQLLTAPAMTGLTESA